MTTYLLDVNLLLALTDPMHLHHEAAHAWYAWRGRQSWATCPLTENGFVRVASHASYPNRPGDASVVLGMLQQLCAGPGHAFWPATVTLRTLLQPQVIMGHGQITDCYLLGLAVAHGGKLATFDQKIQPQMVRGGETGLELIAA